MKHQQLVVIHWDNGDPTVERLFSSKPITERSAIEYICKRFPWYADDSENSFSFVDEPSDHQMDNYVPRRY